MSNFLQNGNRGPLNHPGVFGVIQYLTMLGGYISTDLH